MISASLCPLSRRWDGKDVGDASCLSLPWSPPQVVDATSLMTNFGSLERLREVRGPAAAGVDAGDERQVVDLLLDQIEFADTLLLNVRSYQVWHNQLKKYLFDVLACA